MAHTVLGGRRDFAERLLHAVGNEDRIVAEALVAARREGEVAFDLTFEQHMLSNGISERERADEFCRAVEPIHGPELMLDARHGLREILFRSGPARGID